MKHRQTERQEKEKGRDEERDEEKRVKLGQDVNTDAAIVIRND